MRQIYCAHQGMHNLMFDSGEHALKFLRLGGDHIRTQIGISSNGPEIK